MATGNNISAYTNEPGPSIGESQGFGSGVAAGGNAILDIIPSRTTTIIDRKKQTQLSPEAIDQIIYNALSGQSGVSAIRSAEASSGGYGSSSAALQSADLIANVAGEIGAITGPKVEQSETTTKKKKSIICTTLWELGDLEDEIYREGQRQFSNLSVETICGYHSWAFGVSDWIRRSTIVRRIARYIVLERYSYCLKSHWSGTGFLTVALGEPICYLIGFLILWRKQYA